MKAKRRRDGRCFFVWAVVLLATIGQGRSDDAVRLEAEVIIASFETYVEKLRAPYEQRYADARDRFMGLLEREKDMLTRRADLDALQKLGILMEKVQRGDPRIKEGELDPGILGRFQGFRRERGEICNRYCEEYQEAVGKLFKELERKVTSGLRPKVCWEGPTSRRSSNDWCSRERSTK